MTKYPLITLCGSYNLSLHWAKTCIKSWENILNIDTEKKYVIPDANLSEEDTQYFQKGNFQTIANSEDIVIAALERYPFLKKIREKDLTWRKILDIGILFRAEEKVVLIDTDVLINHPCLLPEFISESIYYMREDSPSYRAKWQIVFKEKMVPALNAGLVIFSPKDIVLDKLEYLTKKYFIDCKDLWWTEQSAWSIIAGNLKNRFLFDGLQTRVVCGYKKRSAQEVIKNEYCYYGSNKQFVDFAEVVNYVDNSTIIHFAGQGKKWFTPSLNLLSSNPIPSEVTEISVIRENTLSFKDKIFIGLRLFLKELR